MKRTGLNTWGSDILLMKPTCAIDSPKRLLSLAFNVLSSTMFLPKTGNCSGLLHTWVKNIQCTCFSAGTPENSTCLFHIIEQANRKSTGAVNKKMLNTRLQELTAILLVPYCGMVNTFSL